MQTEQLLEKLFNHQPDLIKLNRPFSFTQVMQGKMPNEQLAGALIALKNARRKQLMKFQVQ